MMHTNSVSPGAVGTVNRFSRMLGISLRSWSGHSPLSLILRGLVQVRLSVSPLVGYVGHVEQLAG